jgi:uncharacterized protein YjbI with pentapeptide repeats
MAGGADRRTRTAQAGWPLLLAALASLLLAACIFALPALLVPAQTGPAQGVGAVDLLRLENERMALRNQVRATLLQAFGGAFFLVTALLTWRQIQVNKQGQVTERFTRAIEHLGSDDKLDVRLGGIYALEQIARESGSEHGAIVEILSAYVRGHAPRAGADPDPNLVAPPPLRIRSPDLQAAMTVLGRRQVLPGDPPVLELDGLDLRHAALAGANLSGASLAGADLSGTNLRRANLRGADLRRARLATADLREATLRGARLKDADLQGAMLAGADLERADLEGVALRQAKLMDGDLALADLRRANLGEADLQRARLRDARLDGAILWSATLAGADLRGANLSGATLVQADLAGARADGATVWPDGFDWRSARVVVDGR